MPAPEGPCDPLPRRFGSVCGCGTFKTRPEAWFRRGPGPGYLEALRGITKGEVCSTEVRSRASRVGFADEAARVELVASVTRVLLVEDDDGIRDAVLDSLEDLYEVLSASNGRAALAVLEQHTVDVIILDLLMPVMDGETFSRELRARGVTIPIVVTSAGADLRRRTAAMGAVDYLAKPYRLETLIERIGRFARTPADDASGPSPAGACDSRSG